jgi:hypothetical protein
MKEQNSNYYIIENAENDQPTNKPLNILFLTNPPQSFKIPPDALLEAVSDYLKNHRGKLLTAKAPQS